MISSEMELRVHDSTFGREANESLWVDVHEEWLEVA